MYVRSVGRLAALTAATATAVALGTAPATAYFCFVDNLTPQAAAGAASSSGFATFGELAFEFTGLCPAGIEVLAAAAAVQPGTPINVHAVMAGGAESQGKDARGINHLDFAAVDAAMPAAIAACA